MDEANQRKKVIIKAPKPNVAAVGLVPSVIAIQKDKDGNEKAKRYASDEDNYSANYHDGICKESFETTAITKPKPKGYKKLKERRVVGRLLPCFNKNHNSKFVETNIADVFIEDSEVKKKIGIQITFSDGKALEKLMKNKSLTRHGDEYLLFSEPIKRAIESKGESKYPFADRNKTVLALDGWVGVTGKVLLSFKSQEKDFLNKAGYCQIWFVGITNDTVIRLY
jgi:hypothetical protein